MPPPLYLVTLRLHGNVDVDIYNLKNITKIDISTYTIFPNFGFY